MESAYPHNHLTLSAARIMSVLLLQNTSRNALDFFVFFFLSDASQNCSGYVFFRHCVTITSKETVQLMT